MYYNKKVSVIFPVYNERENIRKAIEEFLAISVVDEVVAVDNNSKDGSDVEIKKTKAVYVKETAQGYGAALQAGLRAATGDILVTVEPDGTFKASDINRLLIYSPDYDVVFGTRTSRTRIWSGANMDFSLRMGNWAVAKLLEYLFNGPSLTDVGCTFKLIHRSAYEKIKSGLTVNKSHFSPEFMIRCLEQHLEVVEIPVFYGPRIGTSKITGKKHKAIKLGFIMIGLILKERVKFWFRKRASKGATTISTQIMVFAFSLIVSTLLFFCSALRFPNDDQFILYRYIDNIAQGNGFVFNIAEKVLGSTTPLFTLIAASLKVMFFGVPTPTLVAALNIVLLAGSAVFFFRTARHFLSENFALAAVLVFILNLSRTIPEGMETPLFLLTVFIFLDSLFRKRYYTSSVFLALTVLTRPDAGLIAVLTGFFWWQKEGIVKALKLTAVSIVVALPWLLFAWSYFGTIVPQSLATKTHSKDIYYQSNMQATKVQFAHLSRILWGKLYDPDNLKLQSLFNLLPLLVLAGLGAWRKLNKDWWIIFAIPVVYFVSFSISNPIVFPWYLSQMEPFWILMAFIGLAWLMSKIKNKIAVVIIMSLVILGPFVGWAKAVTTTDQGSKVGYFQIGNYIRDHQLPGDTVGIADIGIVSYVTGARIIDFIGLTNTYAVTYYPVADDCTDPNAFYTVPTDLITDTLPTWLVANPQQLTSCFRTSEWLYKTYERRYVNSTATVWKLRSDLIDGK